LICLSYTVKIIVQSYTLLFEWCLRLRKSVNDNTFCFRQNYNKTSTQEFQFNWWEGKPSGSTAGMGKQQPRFYWSCSSMVIKDATPLTPLAHERNSIFKCKQQTIHDLWGPEKYNYTMIKYEATFYNRHTPAVVSYNKLIKGKALRKHSLHGKTAASVLLKMFISGNERCHTTNR